MGDSVYSAADLMPAPTHTNAKSLVYMLQEQLNQINEEIRFEVNHK